MEAFQAELPQHNTLTVNDKDHNVKGLVEMISTENTSDRLGATFNLAPLFWGDLSKAERAAAICYDKYLEIKDVLAAASEKTLVMTLKKLD